MKLSTKSRYGTRLMLDMAQHYNLGPIHLGDIAKRQDISVKYLEQIIIPLKKAHFIESVRGPKGGHILAKAPAEINLAEIVALLEEGVDLVECSEHAEVCARADSCPTRLIWQEASRAIFDALKSITLADLVEKARSVGNQKLFQTAETAEELLNQPRLLGSQGPGPGQPESTGKGRSPRKSKRS